MGKRRTAQLVTRTLLTRLPHTQPQKEYNSKDGKIYWANTVTKESTWEKPDALKSPFEVSPLPEERGQIDAELSRVWRNPESNRYYQVEAVHYQWKDILCQ
jgi:hypothetical protein